MSETAAYARLENIYLHRLCLVVLCKIKISLSRALRKAASDTLPFGVSSSSSPSSFAVNTRNNGNTTRSSSNGSDPAAGQTARNTSCLLDIVSTISSYSAYASNSLVGHCAAAVLLRMCIIFMLYSTSHQYLSTLLLLLLREATVPVCLGWISLASAEEPVL